MRTSSGLVLTVLMLSLIATKEAGAFDVCWVESSCQPYATEPIVKGAPPAPPPRKVERSKPKAVKTIKAATAPVRATSPPVMQPAVTRKVAIQIKEANPALMERVLDTATQAASHSQTRGEVALIEIVAHGPGLHMLREDTSPVKDRIERISEEHPNISFVACSNTRAVHSSAEGKPISLLVEAKFVPSGVARLQDLRDQGYISVQPGSLARTVKAYKSASP
jgi:intracellular sulfur oxidation DsrE/DsrF family protein